ncbi:MAG: fused MFS/spermidine synthase [Eubacterium sp.]|nr:fused MFS/spermidine synthase [Eubacterium sp.]
MEEDREDRIEKEIREIIIEDDKKKALLKKIKKGLSSDKACKKSALLGSRIYLYLTEFFAGMAVMAVELCASRLLAPYFSSSQIVWTIIIGTIMIAMALGNIYGGRTADKNPDPDKLYKRLLIASVWIAAIPVLGKYIIVGISGLLVITVDTGFLIIAAFAACMVIFVFPLFLLGTVTPSLVKYTTDSLDDNGRVVGSLGAANTIGSIIGTFLPTFVTIPAIGTAVTFLLFSGVLLVLGSIYFISVKRKIISIIVCTVLFIICALFGNRDSFAFWEGALAYEGESVYNYLQVKDTPERTILSTNVLFGVQSVTMKKEGLTGMYYDYAMAAPVIAGARCPEVGIWDIVGDTETVMATPYPAKKILILGMGTGTFARQSISYFGKNNLDIKGVEIDDKITELSYKYFDADTDTEVTTYDGRAYIKADTEKYDVIMVDAYQDITIPFQMSSSEFFTEVYDHLNDDGVMVVNLNMHAANDDMTPVSGSGTATGAAPNPESISESHENGDRSSINTWLCDTIASVFDDVMTIDVPGIAEYQSHYLSLSAITSFSRSGK